MSSLSLGFFASGSIVVSDPGVMFDPVRLMADEDDGLDVSIGCVVASSGIKFEKTIDCIDVGFEGTDLGFASIDNSVAIGVVKEDSSAPPLFIKPGFVAVSPKEKLIFAAFKATTTGNSTERISPLKIVLSDP